MEAVHTVRLLHLADVGLLAAPAVPFGPHQVLADHVPAVPGRQGPLFEAGAALQEVEGSAVAFEEVVRVARPFAGVATAAQRAPYEAVLVAVSPCRRLALLAQPAQVVVRPRAAPTVLLVRHAAKVTVVRLEGRP